MKNSKISKSKFGTFVTISTQARGRERIRKKNNKEKIKWKERINILVRILKIKGKLTSLNQGVT
jgi:hypothetical protein